MVSRAELRGCRLYSLLEWTLANRGVLACECPKLAYNSQQLILPTDKRNPSFSLYLCEEEDSISVFYGLELLEVELSGETLRQIMVGSGGDDSTTAEGFDADENEQQVKQSPIPPSILSLGKRVIRSPTTHRGKSSLTNTKAQAPMDATLSTASATTRARPPALSLRIHPPPMG